MNARPLELRAGPVRLELDGPDLRGLDPGGGPVVQRIYPAFRNAEWETAPIAVCSRRVDCSPSAFAIALEGTAWLGELNLRWTAQAEGEADGTLTYALEVEPLGSFACRRLGLCVHLDAAACAGGTAVAKDGDGVVERPVQGLIAPQPLRGEEYLPMIGPFTELEVSLADGSTVGLETGETPFELEDQRNWADSSLKAYSSGPAGLLRCAPGERLRQRVRLRLAPAPQARRRRGGNRLAVESPTSQTVAPVGLSVPAGWSLPSGIEPAHVRLDVDLGEAEAADPKRFDRLLAGGDTDVELAVHGTAEDSATLPASCKELPLARVLALDRHESSTSPELLQLVRQAVGPGRAMGVGTDAHFSEVCRHPPRLGGAEFVCWSAHPQVHATDDRSVMENLPGLGAQVRTALSLLPSLRPVLSELRLGPAESHDPRGSSSFGAAWAVGAFAQLLRAGVQAVTVAGGPGQEAVVAVAAALMSARGEPLRQIEGVDEGVAALAWGEREVGILVANLGPTDRSVTLELPREGPVLSSPLLGNGQTIANREQRSEGPRLDLCLGPYEALRLAAPC